MPQTLTKPQEQLPLVLPGDAELQERLELQKARELYERSGYLRRKFKSFNQLMADPLSERTLRLCARQCLRLAKKTRGR